MTFEEAYTALNQGKRVRRKSWGEKRYLDMQEGMLFAHNQPEITATYSLDGHIDDIIGHDWDIIEERETVTFITDIQPGKGEFLYIGERNKLKGKYKVTIEPYE